MAQKNCHGPFSPNGPKSWPQALAPGVQNLQAGAIVMKMPMNSTATSMIGPNVNLFAARFAAGVS